ncbi:MAG: hypothetical protein V2A67_02270 [Bacteroidota bacterium]
MKKLSIIRTVASVMLLTCVLAAPDGLFAQSSKLYINSDLSYNFVFGQFNGEKTLAGESDIFLLPKLTGGLGYGGSIGIANQKSAHNMGLKYVRAQFNATFLDESLGKATYNYVGMEHVFFIPTEIWLNPKGRSLLEFLITGGAGVGFLKVPDGHLSLASVSHDALLTSIALPFGGGIVLKPAAWMALSLGAVYKFAFLIKAKNASYGADPLSIDDRVGAGGLVFNTGVFINLGK